MLAPLVPVSHTSTRQVHTGRATTFGRASSDPTNSNDHLACARRVEGSVRSVDPEKFEVALPAWKAGCGAWVQIYLPRTGRSVKARVMDRGPRRAMTREDPDAIDTTEAVRKAVGFTGSENVLWWIVK